MPDDVRKRLIELSEGVYIEDDVLGIIERIQQYDPSLRVQYLAGRGNLQDAPYRIMEMCPDGIERMVMGVWELDERVIQRLFAADTMRHDIMGRLAKINDQARVDQHRRFRDMMEEAKDITEHVIKSTKTQYTIPGEEPGETIVIHSHQPVKTVTKTGREVPK